ncbi:MAG TPA: UbiX family flavin prenyltransferase [Aquificaceae bacterium]|nr:UbiX family flavin prenyltransferase [Aquificaceae bacterium]HIQ48920.1 UbiX family flavin prenyltransferase [Aquifex aeolicus]
MQKVVVCITGASGVIYGIRLIEVLSQLDFRIDLVVSKTARLVLKEEHNKTLEEVLNSLKGINLHEEGDFTSPLASGSVLVKYKGVFIAPCSTSTLAHIANGINRNLIHRIGEVALKEKVPLVLLIRESPYSKIHLENMLKIVEAGGIVLPASPGFYHKPKRMEDLIDFVVGKLLDTLRIKHNLYKRWRE